MISDAKHNYKTEKIKRQNLMLDFCEYKQVIIYFIFIFKQEILVDVFIDLYSKFINYHEEVLKTFQQNIIQLKDLYQFFLFLRFLNRKENIKNQDKPLYFKVDDKDSNDLEFSDASSDNINSFILYL